MSEEVHPIDALLGPGGTLARVMPGYEPREPQLRMARAVSQALSLGRALVVEAGTGTGKTLAYLVPAVQSGLRLVVSTATKTLQEQLRDKDVPLLARLGLPGKVAFLKGRQNYLCLLRKERFDQNPTFTTREEARLQAAVDRWAARTQTGDRAELEEVPEDAPMLREITSTADSCVGQKCAHAEACFVFRARRAAADADVVVVNHHLFFADLALRSSSAGDGGAAVLPRYDGVIFDEAHAVEEVATEHFGVQVSSHRVAELGRDALAALQGRRALARARDLAGLLLREGPRFFEATLALRSPRGPGPGGGPDDRFPLAPGQLAPAEGERVALAGLLSSLAAALGGDGEEPDEEVLLLERRAGTLAAELELFAPQAAGQTGRVLWAEPRGAGLALHASPLDVAPLLQDRLYDRVGPVVFTSATLAVSGSLHYFAERVGLRDASGPLFPTDEAVLPSPFDYARNAALYLPPAMPDPQDPGFIPAVARELERLVAASGGCAFALFTSLRNMRGAHTLLERALAGKGLQVLLQGEAPKARLLTRFRERPSVLFASQSFWEGVDVPGDALRLVVIDKLPFASPGEPLLAARIERLRQEGKEPFQALQVPQAALALKQGFGRLIRSATDRGVVALLDPRVTQKGYGRTFLATLPRCPVVRDPSEVDRFFQGGGR